MMPSSRATSNQSPAFTRAVRHAHRVATARDLPAIRSARKRRQIRGGGVNLRIRHLCRNRGHRPRLCGALLRTGLKLVQTLDGKTRRLPRDARETRAIAFAADRMTGEARRHIGPVANLRELPPRFDLPGLRRLCSLRERRPLCRKVLGEFAHVAVG